MWLPRPMYSCRHNLKSSYLGLLSVYWPRFPKIYRCWIVWGKNIHVTIIPSILAIAYLGQSSCYLHLISRFQFIVPSSLASRTWQSYIVPRPTWGCWLGPGGHNVYNSSRRFHCRECPGDELDRFQDPQEVNPDLVELTTGGTKLRHIIFVIIESGMALSVIQLIRLAFFIMAAPWTVYATPYVVAIQQMFNVTIRSVHIYFFCFTDTIVTLIRALHQQ